MSDGLVAHWTFDEAAGDLVVDASGNEHHGTAYGATRESGVVGDGLRFDGVDDEVWVPARAVPPPAEITSLEAGSIALWLRFEDAGREADPFFYLGREYKLTSGGVDYGGAGLVIEVGHPYDDKLYVTAYLDRKNPIWCFDTEFDLEPGRWYHAVAVVGEDFNTGYLDGVELTARDYNYGDATNHEFFGDFLNVDRLSIGSGLYYNHPTDPAFGMVDDVRIYDRALTAAEVWALYTGSQPPTEPPPTPADLTAVSVTSSSVELVWTDTSDGSSQESGFEVQRASRTTGQGWTTIGTTPSDSATFIDDDVEPATTYGYRVRAVNEVGESDWTRRTKVITPE